MPLVSEQVTDAVTQSNVKVVGEAPAMAMGNVYQSLAHSHGLMFENAVNAQMHGFTNAQAASNARRPCGDTPMPSHSFEACSSKSAMEPLAGPSLTGSFF